LIKALATAFQVIESLEHRTLTRTHILRP
jgi:hypothetical protein